MMAEWSAGQWVDVTVMAKDEKMVELLVGLMDELMGVTKVVSSVSQSAASKVARSAA